MKNDASLFEMALNGEKAAGLPEGIDLNDFYAYMPQHNYIYIPTRELWPASSVNSRIEPIPVLGHDGKPVMDGKKEKTTPAATWLDRNRPVEQMTWVPGEPELILGGSAISQPTSAPKATNAAGRRREAADDRRPQGAWMV